MDATSDLTYDEFIAYLLLMGAHADLIVSEEEKFQICQRVGEENFNKIKKFFDRQNDAQHIDTVAQLYKRYESVIGGKEKLVQMMSEIFRVDDGKEHVMDRYLLIMMKKIL